jgi:hypothetical protein
MLPFYPLNQQPAMNDGERNPRPPNRLEVQMRLLEHERQRYATMQLQTERQGHNPLTVAVQALHQGVASLLATVVGEGHRVRQATTSPVQQTSPADHLCVPGVDC